MDEVKGIIEGLGLTWAATWDGVYTVIAAAVDEYIKNFCNVSKVPEGLSATRVMMIAGRMLQQLKAFGLLGELDFESVAKSISEGDVSITFADGTTPEAAFDAYVAEMATANTAELLRYRRLVW